MESALERTIAAIRNDLGALREELEALDVDVSTRPTKPPASAVSGPKRTVSEELALRRRAKDPRSDD